MKDSKKLEELYEAYLRDSLEHMDREEMIDTFVTTVLKFMDFDQPQVKEQVIKILMRYEARKKSDTNRLEELQDSPPDFYPQELDFSTMSKPNDFDDFLQQLMLYSSSHSDVVDLEDILNATSVAKSMRKYMFDVEVPWVGIIDNMLCLAWSKDIDKAAVIVFAGGGTQIEFTHKEDTYAIEFNEEGELEEEDALRLLAETHALAY